MHISKSTPRIWGILVFLTFLTTIAPVASAQGVCEQLEKLHSTEEKLWQQFCVVKLTSEEFESCYTRPGTIDFAEIYDGDSDTVCQIAISLFEGIYTSTLTCELIIEDTTESRVRNSLITWAGSVSNCDRISSFIRDDQGALRELPEYEFEYGSKMYGSISAYEDGENRFVIDLEIEQEIGQNEDE